MTAEIKASRIQLERAFEEVASYALRGKKKAPSRSVVYKEILQIALFVTLAREIKKAVPSKSQWRRQANECARSIDRQARLLQTCWWTLSTAVPYFDGPASNLFQFAAECTNAAEAFRKLAASKHFRRKGRPPHEFDENVLLLQMCRDLLRRYGGRVPGLRMGSVKPSPLIRLAMAIVMMTGEDVPSFNRILSALKKGDPNILRVHEGNQNPIVAAIKALLTARS